MGKERQRRVVIVCSYPPPYGGMPIYAERFSAYLLKNGSDCKVINLSPEKNKCRASHVLAPPGGRLLKYFSSMWLLLLSRPVLVHINASGGGSFWGSLALCAFCKLTRLKVVLSMHGSAFVENVSRYGVVRGIAARVGLSCADHVICVNSAIQAAVQSFRVSEDSTSVIPGFCLAYLPESVPRSRISKDVLAFCESHSPVIVAGPRLEIQSSGGWQTPILAFRKLKQRFREVGMIIVGSGDKEAECRKMIESKGLSRDIFLAGDVPHPEVVAIFKQLADVMVRPTMNDGDSAFVREGIALCKPVVASDTDFRPEGVILFKKGDASDLASKIEYALEHKKEIEARSGEFEHPDYFAQTVKVYAKLRQQSRNQEV